MGSWWEASYRNINVHKGITANSQIDFSLNDFSAGYYYEPSDDSLLSLNARMSRLLRKAPFSDAKDARGLSVGYETSAGEDISLSSDFSYDFSESSPLSGDLDRYRASLSLVGNEAFGHECIDWGLRFSYLKNAGFAYSGVETDRRTTLGASLSYSSLDFGTFSFGYTFSDLGLNIFDFSLMPFELKVAPFALDSDYAPYRTRLSPKVHLFELGHRVYFGRGFSLRQSLEYERVKGVADLSVLDARYQNLFPNRRLNYLTEFLYTPCKNWRYSIVDRYERRKNTIRHLSLASNYLSLTATYSPEDNTAYSATLGRYDFNSSEPTVSLYETDLIDWGLSASVPLSKRIAMSAYYYFTYTTGRDKYEADNLSLYLTIDGKYPLNIGYNLEKVRNSYYIAADTDIHSFLIECEYRF